MSWIRSRVDFIEQIVIITATPCTVQLGYGLLPTPSEVGVHPLTLKGVLAHNREQLLNPVRGLLS